MVGCTRRPGKRAEIRFADPPWNERSDEWQIRDRQVPVEHPARAVVEAMKQLNVTPLFDLYVGAGSPPIRPDLMLAIARLKSGWDGLSLANGSAMHERTWSFNGRASESVRRGLVGMTLLIASRPCSNSGTPRCFNSLGKGV